MEKYIYSIEAPRRYARSFHIFRTERWRFSVISKIILSNITPVSRLVNKSKPHACTEWHIDRTCNIYIHAPKGSVNGSCNRLSCLDNIERSRCLSITDRSTSFALSTPLPHVNVPRSALAIAAIGNLDQVGIVPESGFSMEAGSASESTSCRIKHCQRIDGVLAAQSTQEGRIIGCAM